MGQWLLSNWGAASFIDRNARFFKKVCPFLKNKFEKKLFLSKITICLRPILIANLQF